MKNTLILINGPCGIGKSTVAMRLHDTLPLSYLVNVDAIARNISHYREYENERRVLREAVAYKTCEAVLEQGRDVIVEKMIYRPEVLEGYYRVAKLYQAQVVEIILWAEKDVVLQRAHARGWRPGGSLTPEKCEMFWEQIDRLKDNRSQAHIIDITEMNEEAVLKAVQEAIEKETR